MAPDAPTASPLFKPFFMDFFLTPTRTLVADLGSSHVAVGLFAQAKNGQLILEDFQLERISGNPSDEGRWAEQVAEAFRRVADQPSLCGPVSVALPGHLALVKTIKTPAIKSSKRDKMIEFEAGQAIPFPLTEVIWDHELVLAGASELEILLAAAKSDAMSRLCAEAETQGHAITRAMPACIALMDAFRFNYPEERRSTLIVDVGARSTQLLFVEADGKFFARTLAFGGNGVTQQVADELRLDFDAAERLKLELLSADGIQLGHTQPWRTVVAAVDSFSSRLAGEVTRSTVGYARQPGSTTPVVLFLTGGGSQLEHLIGSLEQKLQLTVHRFDPFRGVQLKEKANPHLAVRESALLATMVGLAVQATGDCGARINLLPAVLKDELLFRRLQPWFIAAAVLAMAAVLPALRYFHAEREIYSTQAVAMDRQLSPVRSARQRDAALMEQLVQAKLSFDALHRVAEQKTVWIRFIQDLQDRLVKVEDVWIESLTILREPAPKAGSDDVKSLSARGKIALSGRLLDRENPVSRVSPESYQRVNQLMARVRESEFIAGVEQERFDNSQPGILRFNFTLKVRDQTLL